LFFEVVVYTGPAVQHSIVVAAAAAAAEALTIPRLIDCLSELRSTQQLDREDGSLINAGCWI